MTSRASAEAKYATTFLAELSSSRPQGNRWIEHKNYPKKVGNVINELWAHIQEGWYSKRFKNWLGSSEPCRNTGCIWNHTWCGMHCTIYFSVRTNMISLAMDQTWPNPSSINVSWNPNANQCLRLPWAALWDASCQRLKEITLIYRISMGTKTWWTQKISRVHPMNSSQLASAISSLFQHVCLCVLRVCAACSPLPQEISGKNAWKTQTIDAPQPHNTCAKWIETVARTVQYLHSTRTPFKKITLSMTLLFPYLIMIYDITGWWCNNHLEKIWVCQWKGWHPIYEMENNSHVWNILKPPDDFSRVDQPCFFVRQDSASDFPCSDSGRSGFSSSGTGVPCRRSKQCKA